MIVTCPRCRRTLSSVSADAPPLFCMYCGQKLAASSPTAETYTRTFTPQAGEGLSGSSEDDVPIAPEQPPREIGGYRLLRMLGAGGMGTVYEAEAPGSGTHVALKLLSARLASNPASVERFRQEGRLASQLAHPRCVFVLSADTDNGRPYIVMELMPGRTLKDLVDERGPMAPHEAVARVLDVIDGLAEAHRVGLIHRDVKPSNCFLTADDRVKIGDFGLSKSLTSSRDNTLTQTGTFLGTVLFASPEQIRGEPLDYGSDVYSVAATLYFLLCGEAPFHHESPAAALARAISDPPPRLRTKRKDVSARLERIVTKGLERDRARRWQTLDDLREALVDLLPDRQRPARPRALVGAYCLDVILTTVALFVPWELVQKAVGSLRVPVVGVNIDLVAWGITTAYFALCEGLLGATAGKALLGLRVSRVGQTGPPGVFRAALRATVFALTWMWILDGSRLAVLLVAAGEGALGGGFSLFTLATGFAALAVQLRKSWGFRGLHDFASGCHVTQRPLPARKLRLPVRRPTPLETVLPPAEALPEAVGGYVVRGRLSADPTGEQVWLAEDRSLGRTVLLWLRPWGTVALADPARHTRLRRLGAGNVAWGGAAYDWTAFAAPLGGPLAEAVRPGSQLPWADARYLIEQLAEEFRAAEADDSVPPQLALDHVWVEPTGRVQVLDFPLCAARYRPSAPLVVLREAAALVLEGRPRASSAGVAAPLPAHARPVMDRLFAADLPLAEFQKELAETHAHRPEVTPAVRTAHLGLQAVILGAPLVLLFVVAFMIGVGLTFEAEIRAEQVQRASTVLADPAERAQFGVGADKALEEALADPRVRARVNDLAARTRAEARVRRANLFRPQRRTLETFEQTAGVTGRDDDDPAEVREIVMWAGAAEKTAAGRADSPWTGEAWQTSVVFLMVLLGLVTLAAGLRGGFSLLLAGIAIVRADGRPAYRRQCAARALVIWFPVVGLLFGSVVLQTFAPSQSYLAAGLWLAAAVLLPAYAVIAVRLPTRPPQDRILGTYLVPV